MRRGEHLFMQMDQRTHTIVVTKSACTVIIQAHREAPPHMFQCRS